jgi:hypothetical protein
MKEQEVLVRIVYDYEDAARCQNMVQDKLMAGWQIVRTEHNGKAILVVFEKDSPDDGKTNSTPAITFEQVEKAFKNGYALGSNATGKKIFKRLLKDDMIDVKTYSDAEGETVHRSVGIDNIKLLAQELNINLDK